MVGLSKEIAREQRDNCGLMAYRMRKRVTYHERGDSPVLVLNFPLKVISLHSFWRKALKRISDGNFAALEEIVSLTNYGDQEQITTFLNSLVRKGFLEQEGLPILTSYPYVTIIIPVRNRPQEITECLQSLSRLDYPGDRMEVIVVDDASTDDTPHAISKFPVKLISLRERRQASFCRNLAAQRAKGEILAFLDSDCMVDPLWLRELVPAFSDPSLGAVGGLVDSYFCQKGLDRYEKVKSSLNTGFWPKSSGDGDHFFYVPSCNLLIKRSCFIKVGGFRADLHVGEDVDLCWRVQDLGYQVEYRPVGKVYHRHRNRITDFCRRRFDYGSSEPLLQQLHAKRIKKLLFPPGHNFFWGLVLLTAILKFVPLLSLCGLMILFDSLGKFAEMRRRNIPIGASSLALATIRSYFAFLHHCCAFVSRYYLFWCLLLLPLAPLASMIILGMHLLTGFVEYFIKKPSLNLLLFVFYFSLDQLSYQLGVWWGCLKKHYFNPVNPYIVTKPFSKEIR